MLYSIKNFLIEQPWAGALFQTINNILIGIFSGSFVTEITTSNGLAWSTFYHATSFYCLSLVVVIAIWYTKATYDAEINMLKFADKEYCTAYMRSKFLPEVAQQSIQALRDGDPLAHEEAMITFEATMATFKKVLK